MTHQCRWHTKTLWESAGVKYFSQTDQMLSYLEQNWFTKQKEFYLIIYKLKTKTYVQGFVTSHRHKFTKKTKKLCNKLYITAKLKHIQSWNIHWSITAQSVTKKQKHGVLCKSTKCRLRLSSKTDSCVQYQLKSTKNFLLNIWRRREIQTVLVLNGKVNMVTFHGQVCQTVCAFVATLMYHPPRFTGKPVIADLVFQ